MIQQEIHIPGYDWNVTILYDVTERNASPILDCLWDMGCKQTDLIHAEEILRSGTPNQGLIYSDKKNKESLIVIGRTTDIFQFLNSVGHEVNHLEAHICEAYDINMHSEEAAYLSGDIKEIIARNAWRTMKKLFLFLL